MTQDHGLEREGQKQITVNTSSAVPPQGEVFERVMRTEGHRTAP